MTNIIQFPKKKKQAEIVENASSQNNVIHYSDILLFRAVEYAIPLPSRFCELYPSVVHSSESYKILQEIDALKKEIAEPNREITPHDFMRVLDIFKSVADLLD